MQDPIRKALNHHFGARLRNQIVAALRIGYKYAQESHLAEAGANNQTFGYTVYWYCLYQLASLSEDPTLGVLVLSRSPEFRLCVGPVETGFVLASHRVGAHSWEDIHSCFPRSPNGPSKLAQANVLQFELQLEGGVDQTPPRNLILAHLGNPKSGLEAVYLAVPFGKGDGPVTEWRYTESLWNAGSARDVDEPQAVAIEDPEITLRSPEPEEPQPSPTPN